MSVYLDAGVLISFLYAETDAADKAEASARLFEQIQSQRVLGLVTFYTLPELYSYVALHYTRELVDETFRTSLVELLSYPIILKPFVERSELEKLRRQISIRDSYDIYHVVSALHYKCSAIITFDHHFHQVRDIIPVYTPQQYFNFLAQESTTE
jgi:predicted nucleic acid-binding protein